MNKIMFYECVKCNRFFLNLDDYAVHNLLHDKWTNNFVDHVLSPHIILHRISTSSYQHSISHYKEVDYEKKIKGKYFRTINYPYDVEKEAKKLGITVPEYLPASHFVNKYGLLKKDLNGKYSCSMCRKVFGSPIYMYHHLAVHSGYRPYLCQKCGKNFTQRISLIQHIRRHLNIRSFVCQLCDKSFVELNKLKNHYRIHTGNKPYKCDVCEKSFSDPSACRRHKLIHTGLKPYTCVYCSKRFADSSALYRHKKIHENGRIKCSECEKSFITIQNLQSHKLAIHVNKGPFICDYCGHVYHRKHNLTKHINIHFNVLQVSKNSRNKIFECQYCECINRYKKEDLQNHLKRCHKENFKD